MVFSSFTFLAFFFPVVLILHFFVFKNIEARNVLLLVCSLFFYAWGEPVYVLVMILSISVNYFCGIFMESASKKAFKNLWMLVGVILSVGFLFYFKYYAFIGNSLLSLFGMEASIPTQTLPIGISFYTFQILTYTIDVWRGKVPAQKNIIKLGLYISFFPQLIAGPVVNYTYIEPYLSKRSIKPSNLFNGFYRFFIGLGKKVLLANSCGEILSVLESNGTAGEMSVLCAWLSAIAYTLQIYFDFSGYSDMAIGMGEIFGFPFLENFNYPYMAKSITDFWRRWHISLSSFFRDYVYIPLGGSRKGASRQIFNLLVVWTLTGLWHGASWNFVIWGLYYGVLLICEKFVWGKLLNKLPGFVQWMYTMLVVVIGWVFFYHDSLSDGISHIKALFGIGVAGLSDPVSVYAVKYYAVILVVSAICCISFKSLKKDNTNDLKAGKMPSYLIITRFVIGTAFLVLSLVCLTGSSFNPFLYFRF